MTSKVKRVGCCTICDKKVFEVKEVFNKAPMEGWPRRLGKPTDDAWRIDYIMLDGSHIHLTFCTECLETAQQPETYPALWNSVLQTFIWESQPEVRRIMPCAAHTPKQQEAFDQFIEAQMKNALVSVLVAQKWSDVIA